MRSCNEFRRVLEQSLSGAAVVELRWHEHVLTCADCRELLEAEEALDALLASLPAPTLPPHLARRVLARLRLRVNEQRASHDAALDGLLARDGVSNAPPELAARVLSGLKAERVEARLDLVLERGDRVDTPHDLASRVLAGVRVRAADERLDRLLERAAHVDVPTQLAARVRSGLADALRAERELARLESAANAGAVIPSSRFANARARRFAWAAAALVVVTASVWFVATRDDASTPVDIARGNGAPERGMLVVLDELEHYDLLLGDDLDLFLSTVAPADEALLEYTETKATDPATPDAGTPVRRKG